MCPVPIASGNKGDVEFGISWWFFHSLSRDEVFDFCERNQIERHYSGPGKLYFCRPIVRYGKSHTLITQMCGLDI